MSASAGCGRGLLAKLHVTGDEPVATSTMRDRPPGLLGLTGPSVRIHGRLPPVSRAPVIPLATLAMFAVEEPGEFLHRSPSPSVGRSEAFRREDDDTNARDRGA
jgi:hypothetical protein